MSKLDTIELFFKKYHFKPNNLDLDHEDITDLRKFVTTHLSYLKANSGNKAYLSYFDRLKKVYFILK